MKIRIPPIRFVPIFLLWLLFLGYYTIDFRTRDRYNRLWDITLPGWEDWIFKEFVVLFGIFALGFGLISWYIK